MLFASLCAATLAGLIVALSEPQMDEDLFDMCYPVDENDDVIRRRLQRNATIKSQILDSRMEVLVENYEAHLGA